MSTILLMGVSIGCALSARLARGEDRWMLAWASIGWAAIAALDYGLK